MLSPVLMSSPEPMALPHSLQPSNKVRRGPGAVSAQISARRTEPPDAASAFDEAALVHTRAVAGAVLPFATADTHRQSTPTELDKNYEHIANMVMRARQEINTPLQMQVMPPQQQSHPLVVVSGPLTPPGMFVHGQMHPANGHAQLHTGYADPQYYSAMHNAQNDNLIRHDSAHSPPTHDGCDTCKHAGSAANSQVVMRPKPHGPRMPGSMVQNRSCPGTHIDASRRHKQQPSSVSLGSSLSAPDQFNTPAPSQFLRSPTAPASLASTHSDNHKSNWAKPNKQLSFPTRLFPRRSRASSITAPASIGSRSVSPQSLPPQTYSGYQSADQKCTQPKAERASSRQSISSTDSQTREVAVWNGKKWVKTIQPSDTSLPPQLPPRRSRPQRLRVLHNVGILPSPQRSASPVSIYTENSSITLPGDWYKVESPCCDVDVRPCLTSDCACTRDFVSTQTLCQIIMVESLRQFVIPIVIRTIGVSGVISILYTFFRFVFLAIVWLVEKGMHISSQTDANGLNGGAANTIEL